MSNQVVEFDANQMTMQGKSIDWQSGPGNLKFYVSTKQLDVRIHHVMVQQDGKIAYDTILRAERGAGASLLVTGDGKIGLQRRWRAQSVDPQSWRELYPHLKLSSLGRDSYEVPRGFADRGESGLQTALREAEEETGLEVRKFEVLGYVCDNTAFSPHLTEIALVKPDLRQQETSKQDTSELMEVEWKTLDEICLLQEQGLLYDAYTLSALALYMLDQKRRSSPSTKKP